jgi:hypothetical protein
MDNLTFHTNHSFVYYMDFLDILRDANARISVCVGDMLPNAYLAKYLLVCHHLVIGGMEGRRFQLGKNHSIMLDNHEYLNPDTVCHRIHRRLAWSRTLLAMSDSYRIEPVRACTDGDTANAPLADLNASRLIPSLNGICLSTGFV